MRGWLLTLGAVVAALAVAAVLRSPGLDSRPMHGDEAVHAIKLDELLRTGRYIYDPHEYHGPTLYYATLPVSWALGARDIRELDEVSLRIVPAAFGLATILLLLLLRDGLGNTATSVAALLAAVSPALAFYSRYYIQETLLVFFTTAALAAAWRWSRRPGVGWAIALGSAVGLMHATKETCVIALGCGAIAAAATLWTQRGADAPQISRRQLVRGSVAAFCAAVFVSIAFYSAMFTHARGPLDSILTYATYFDRAGSHGLHNHPWWFYAQRFLWYHVAPGPTWSEAAIILPAIAAIGLAFRRTAIAQLGASPALAAFLALYTALLTLVYTALPYKTPWCGLGFLQPMTMLAGVFVAALLRLVPSIFWRGGVVAALLVAAHQLYSLAHLTNRLGTDNRSPYVYAHPLRGVVVAADYLTRVAAAQPEGARMRIAVYTDDSWPLPWYLRRLDAVGYWAEPPAAVDAAAVVVFPENREAVERAAKVEYVTHEYGLRPGLKIAVMVRRDAYERFVAASQAEGSP